MANVLVCGAKGQLGSAIQAVLPKEDNYFYTDKTALDITDKSAIAKFLRENRIEILVNCAGYTAVDRAEDEVEKADLLNNVAVRNLAEICAEKRVFLIHISTDYVFDGQKNTPYTETDLPNPQTVYGTTKWQGEKAIQEICTDYLILRTAWLYSPYGHNFVKTIARLAKERKELKVVADQMGTPTNATDLAYFIVYFIETKRYENHRGIYHFSNEGVCSWYEFAKEIITLLGLSCEVKPCASVEYPTKAVRPRYSVLDKSKIHTTFGYKVANWQESLALFLTRNPIEEK
ncbi:MAG: dTDP-4-dehydrorhamnose reductase [Flavobacteriaceae bacterium]|nr:dTDP-4-dehydrorhamnose reductase [Flavobacteriaceae bacterium]